MEWTELKKAELVQVLARAESAAKVLAEALELARRTAQASGTVRELALGHYLDVAREQAAHLDGVLN